AQQLEIPPHGLDAAVEIRQVELLVGSVEVVVRQAKAHHDYGNVQVIVEQSGDGNGAAGAHVDGLLLEDLLHRLSGGFDVTVLGRDHGGGRRADEACLGRDAARRELLDVSGILPDDLFRVHVRDQTHADRRRGDGGYHRFCPLAHEAAEYTG